MPTPLEPLPDPVTPTLRQIQLPGRLRLAFAEQGRGSGTPVIALHGVTDSWRSFEPLLPHLPSDLRLIALSQRGHGDSDKPAAGFRPNDFADDVMAFTDAMETCEHWEEPQRFARDLSRFVVSLAVGAATV